MKINDELFLAFEDKGTLPGDTEISVTMKMGTYRELIKAHNDSVIMKKGADVAESLIPNGGLLNLEQSEMFLKCLDGD